MSRRRLHIQFLTVNNGARHSEMDPPEQLFSSGLEQVVHAYPTLRVPEGSAAWTTSRVWRWRSCRKKQSGSDVMAIGRLAKLPKTRLP